MYHHTQVGWFIVIPVTIGITILTITGIANSTAGPIILAAVLLVVLVLFSALTVNADQEEISWYFGPGVVRRTSKYSEIASVKPVRNPWYYGWGVRWFVKGWLYNVQGLDALELTLKNGKIVRIGTDEPERLLEFVNKWMK